MPVKRRVDKHRDVVISETARKLFAEMMQTSCTCSSREDRVMDPCPGCWKWNELETHLHRALGLKLWEFPSVFRGCSPDLEQALAEAAVQRLA